MSAVVHSLAVCKGILKAAAWLVPAKARAEWLAEWNAELWHVWQQADGVAPVADEAQPTAFCLGAFKDAFWLRREGAGFAPRTFLRAGTASRCMLSLLLTTAVAMFIAYCRLGVWNVVRPYHYGQANDLVMISRGGFAATPVPTITLAEFAAWKVKSRHLFTGLAFYNVSSQSVRIERDGDPPLHGCTWTLHGVRCSL